jgi:hypothetical protein
MQIYLYTSVHMTIDYSRSYGIFWKDFDSHSWGVQAQHRQGVYVYIYTYIYIYMVVCRHEWMFICICSIYVYVFICTYGSV